MHLVPIQESLEENQLFINHPDCQESLLMTIDFYKKVGYNPPWIGYYAFEDDQVVAMAAFKGKPIDQQVEIAYGTIERFRHQGIGTLVCKLLVDLALQNDTSIVITARTLPERNYSTRILENNKFRLKGVVQDPEDGEVWEWIYDQK